MNYQLPLFFLSLFTLPASFGNTIYRCDTADGGVSLQQQPCSGAAKQKRYSFFDENRSDDSRRPAAPPARSQAQPQSRRQTTPRRSTKARRNPVGKQITQCRKLWNREDDLRDTERTGYTAAEGEKMRREQRRIKRDKELLHCDELD